MKQVTTITANDGSSKVKVTVELQTKKSLADYEARMAMRGLIRGCADGIRGATYTDFGAENTTVKP